VGIARVNIAAVELDRTLDEAGFHHAAARIGPRLGANRIGAGVYHAEAGVPIWPYHYHHGIEEWLYVVAGAPVLREPAGERTLRPGDLMCFPAGHVGAHTLKGPGRFVIFSTGSPRRPYMSVYPDSDKASGPAGILLRSSAVGYWHGEGTHGPAEPDEIRREPEWLPPQPVVNALDGGEPELGGQLLDASVLDLGPGERREPYHYVWGREVWLLVLAGTPTLRHAAGEDELGAGDLVCRAEGPDGGHELRNDGQPAARVLRLSTTDFPANTCYPEAGRWVLSNRSGEEETVLP